jgi:hypothetical protein
MIRNFLHQRPPKRIFSCKSRPQATRPAGEQNFSFSYSQKNPRLTIHGSTHPRANPTAFSQHAAPPFSPRRCPSRGEHRDRGATIPNMSRWKASVVAATQKPTSWGGLVHEAVGSLNLATGRASSRVIHLWQTRVRALAQEIDSGVQDPGRGTNGGPPKFDLPTAPREIQIWRRCA